MSKEIFKRAMAGEAGGRIAAEVVCALGSESAAAVETLMLQLMSEAQKLAMPAVSGFSVGAVAQGMSGALYFGANFEFADCPIDQTLHAEQAAVVNALNAAETGIRRLAVSAAPCGYCRQFLFELSSADELLILLEGLAPTRLTDYLPQAFGPGDLGVTARLMTPQNHPLSIAEQDAGYTPSAGAKAALAAARSCYAPYTEAFAGAAITARDGAIYRGSYVENAAFNPSIPPMQAAVILARLAGCTPDRFSEACVAQRSDAKIDHLKTAAIVLASLAPDLPIQHLPLTHG
ncbi:MAG: cytidine deaminase [Rhizobiaceae bacterium]